MFLRGGRVFRILWYMGLESDDTSESVMAIFVHFMKVTAKHLEAVGNEIFVAKKTRGGSILVLILFFITYLYGVVFWNETSSWSTVAKQPSWWVPNSNPIPCDSLSHCMITFFRFCMFDGNGWDFITNLHNSGKPGLHELAMVYLLLCGIIIFNGLINVFGGAFGMDDEEVFDPKIGDDAAKLVAIDIDATEWKENLQVIAT